jgi:hypothetical protein
VDLAQTLYRIEEINRQKEKKGKEKRKKRERKYDREV